MHTENKTYKVMNKAVISTERLKELEAIEELNIQLLTETITLKAKNKVLEDRVNMLKTELNLLKNEKRG